MGQSIVVTSGKGGTGKTTLLAGISSCLSAIGKHVICVDADVGLRNLDVTLGLSDKSVFDFNDVLENRVSINDALLEHPKIPRLFLLAAPAGIAPSAVDALGFSELIFDLTKQADYVFVDSSAGLDIGFNLAAGACERAIVVANPDTLSMRDGARAASLLEGRCRPIHLVVNKVRPRMIRHRYAADIDDIMDATGLPLLGIVPDDEIVMASVNQGVPAILAASSGASAAYLNIALRIVGEKVKMSKIKIWKMIE